MKRVVIVFGTRPEAIKMAPVIHRLSLMANLSVETVSTGQHGGMLSQAMEVFQIQPTHQLTAMRPGQTLSSLGATLLLGIEGVLLETKPDLVLVHGDTSSAMFAALAAFNQGIAVGHVEAGLRTYNLSEPFPEEWNRVAISKLAGSHFSPTSFARDNLLREGISSGTIHVVGNTIVDSVRFVQETYLGNPAWMAESSLDIQRSVFPKFGSSPFALITLHRRENAGSTFESYLTAIRKAAQTYPSFSFVFPVHPNPSISALAEKLLKGIDNVHLIQPLDYLTFSHLLARSAFVISDSGGIQEEAVTYGKALLLCRGTTERPEAVAAGLAELIGVDFERFEARVSQLIQQSLANPSIEETQELNLLHNPYGDGFAANKIAQLI